MVSIRPSRPGLLGATAFLALFLICLLGASLGNWQSVFLVWMVTLPFSLVCHAIGGALQGALGLSDQARAGVEWGLLGITGLVEFYLMGVLLGRGLKR